MRRLGKSPKTGLAACLATLIALAIPSSLLGATDSFRLEVSILNGENETYTLIPGRAYRIAVWSGDPNISQVTVRLTGPQLAGLTSFFEMVWNSSGFHDLGISQAGRLLVAENSTHSDDLWSFAIVLPNETVSGTWEARASAGGNEGVAGFQVSSTYWGFKVLSQSGFPNLVPGEMSTSTIRLGLSCNGDFLLNFSCPGLSGTGSVGIAPGGMLLDDDPVHPEENETGEVPHSFQEGFLEGPAVEAGVDQEVEVYLSLLAPNPMARETVQGTISVELEPVDEMAGLLVDAYVQLLRYLAESLEPPGPVTLKYAADLDTASHKSGILFPLDIKLKQLEVLEEAGVDVIRITPAYDIFLHQYEPKIAELDSLVSQIRTDGKELMIADGAAEEYWSNPMNWSAFSEAFIQRVGDLAARYQPEYYVVVKEPFWYLGMDWTGPAGMLTESTTVEQWVLLTQRLCDEVKRVSPSTLTGVAIALPFPESVEYLIDADKLQNLDFVGIDLYNVMHLETVEYLLPQLTKPRWILETWDGNPDDHQGETWRRTTSAEWIRMVANYAKSRGLEGMATFFNLFLCYDYGGKPIAFDQVRVALNNRQESFYALRSVIGDGS